MAFKREKDVVKNWGGEVVVSILCQTYNQKNFIRDALDSLLMQETNFAFEVIIRDDASSDGTAEIIREYQEKYPRIIKPIYEIENQMTKGLGMIPGKLPQVMKGRVAKYIAFCDGDDYWTTPYKLQKQIDFLEQNPVFMGSAHASRYLRGSEVAELVSVPPEGKTEYTFEEYLGSCYFQTSSWVYRYDTNVRCLIDKYFYKKCGGDVYMSLVFMTLGPIKYFDEVMSVWRVNEQGEWHKNSSDVQVMQNLAASSKTANILDDKYRSKFYEMFYENVKKISPIKFSSLLLNNYKVEEAQEIISMLAEVVVSDESPIAKNIKSKDIEIESRDSTIKECNEYIKLLEGLLEAEKSRSLLRIVKSRVTKLLK
ncbi:glycosyltransferase [Francisella sp. Scap27]|uniref:glycosyltransferase family 2 protein n=1 Tax=Francisella sp. Scap27 TaxID=2589986 RepID=UPI0015BB8742|nr:glycosyltransferase [Francisella sp. Scap27]QLE78826.1 glycosyltransferase [Francisella sp. Scap27]